ncbi:MAG TPA: RimK/LysX family protein [Patescibacteria group bacterium]|nr:RimK/LysX family protein [Patescibacteria group bacterium]
MAEQRIDTVGSTELVDFPAAGLANVPAKVDTGADSSAIWASDIREQDGVLSFTLFGPASPFYTGQALSTKDYTYASIKNSFGDSEFRYKVYLQMRIAGRLVRARFTLADRSANSMPVLIGRRTLRGKFVVDVTKMGIRRHVRVLVLETKALSSMPDFLHGVSEQLQGAFDFKTAVYEDLEFRVGGNQQTNVRLLSGEDIADFDLVFFKTRNKKLHIAAAAALYLEKRGVPFVDRAVGHVPATDKLQQYVRLENSDIAVPQSIYAAPQHLPAKFDELRTELGMPFILKDLFGAKGTHNYLVDGEASFVEACKTTEQAGVALIAQRFIANDGDFRILVMDKSAEIIILRRAQEGTHLNNTSTGGNAALVGHDALPSEVYQNAIRAAQLLELDIAGVDMVQEKHSGLWYCLEVNEAPQISTGVFVAEKQAAFAAHLARTARKKGLGKAL